MRSDIPLYIVALICFIAAIYTYATLTETQLYLYALTVIGIVFVGLGYLARPKSTTLLPSISPAPPPREPTKPEAPQTTAAKKEPEKTPIRKTRKKRSTRRRKKTA